VELSDGVGQINRFRRSLPKYQQTFATPLKDVHRFVATIRSSVDIHAASVVIKTCVFEPKHLLALFAAGTEHLEDKKLTAAGGAEVAALLEAALADWVDFLFVPVPKAFTIYADHDEYATFFANTRSNLNRISVRLQEAGFRTVNDYVRRF
jgi:hypothetical protein